MYTLQEAFDKVVLAVVAQGRPSISPSGDCVYRSPDGSKCAAGHILEDGDFVEGGSVYAKEAQIRGKYFEDDELGFNLLNELQVAHDNAPRGPDFVGGFVDAARDIAGRFNLTMPPELP